MMIIVIPLLLLQIITSFVFLGRHWEIISKRMALSFAGEINTMVELIESAKNIDEQQLIIQIAETNMGLNFRFYPNMKFKKGLNPEDLGIFDRKFYLRLENHVEKPMAIMSSKHEDHIILHLLLNDGILEINVLKRKFFSLTTNTFLIWIFTAGIILFGIASVFLKNQVKSVSKLSAVADKFGKGQEIGDFKPQGADEVRQAGIAFLKMKNRIQRQISERTMMLAAISHDLRTPLTRMKLELALMEGENVEGLKVDILEMEKMINGYLAFIKGGGREIAEIIDFSPFITEITAQFKKQGLNIDLNIEDSVEVKIRKSDLTRAISNIITNAGKYAKNIAIIVRKENNNLIIIINDDGPGIPKESRADVFKAFYRLDPSRNNETGGIGLGLTIARDTVLAHGGDIFLDDSPLGGLKAVINIPL